LFTSSSRRVGPVSLCFKGLWAGLRILSNDRCATIGASFSVPQLRSYPGEIFGTLFTECCPQRRSGLPLVAPTTAPTESHSFCGKRPSPSTHYEAVLLRDPLVRQLGPMSYMVVVGSYVDGLLDARVF